jgi:MPBQ/MSBQ methyltransferase
MAMVRTRTLYRIAMLARMPTPPSGLPDATRYSASLVERGANLSMHLGWFEGAEELPLDVAQARLDALVLGAAGFDVARGEWVGSGAPPERVLDVACGLGGTLARLSAMTSATLVGVDRDEGQLRQARSAPWARAERATFLRADACALPFEAGSFDLVLSVEAAFHFPSRAAFFAEVARVLRPGGALVMTDIVYAAAAPGALTVPARDSRVDDASAALDACLGPWPDPFCAEGTVEELAAQAGLALTEQRDLSAGTLASAQHFLGPGASLDWPPPPGTPELPRGVTALGWLQAEGHQRVVLLRFARQDQR